MVVYAPIRICRLTEYIWILFLYFFKYLLTMQVNLSNLISTMHCMMCVRSYLTLNKSH